MELAKETKIPLYTVGLGSDTPPINVRVSRFEFGVAAIAFAGVLMLGILKGVLLAAVASILISPVLLALADAYSERQPDGSYAGFNGDVATEIARRLGVDVAFELPSFDLVVAGSWNDRWDMSVGSVTITAPRKEVLDFTRPYAYNPAQIAVSTPRMSLIRKAPRSHRFCMPRVQ